MKFLSLILFLPLVHCAGTKSLSSIEKRAQSRHAYSKVIKKNSKKIYRYRLVQNVFQGTLLFFNSEVQNAFVNRKSFFYDWSEEEAEQERKKVQEANEKSASFILSFYIINRHLNKLHIPSKKWKIFIKKDGRKIYGKIMNISADNSVLQTYYPFHSHFNKIYKIVFPVPLKEIEEEKFTVKITSHIGSSVASFDPF